MYKVLVVDDERIILEGISKIIDWNKHDCVLMGTAKNGLEALAAVQAERPDIIITDIKMPGMNGLQLVEKVSELYPGTAFIMLSGFSEFDYAREAMRFGVKHYLLKPCNENAIKQALDEVTGELRKVQSHEQFLANIQTELTKVLPHAKEQFLKELVTNKTYGRRDWNDYGSLFNITVQSENVQLVLFQLEGSYEYEHLFAMKNIAEDVLGSDIVLLSTTIGKHLLLLVKESGETGWLFTQLNAIKSIFTGYYKMDATIALSEAGEITEARSMYRETVACLNYRFYLGEGSIITKRDIEGPNHEGPQAFIYDEETLGMHVKSGDWGYVQQELDAIFTALSEIRLDEAMAKSYVIPLYVSIVRESDPSQRNGYLQTMAKLDELVTLQSLKQFITDAAHEICMNNYHLQQKKHSQMIRRMIDIIHEHIGNPELSLSWVACEILYMNADYIGKLFKKETGEKFSNFVMKLRIEKAVLAMNSSEDVKVFELAERFGFGDNPQYFSQVFKKVTGCTPSEYKRTP